MAATAATSGPPAHRYTSMLAEKELAKFHHTFSTFDRDGGGDVDINELGVMFRQLGHRPSDAEMREMIYAVDADSSGTIDFEEFCLLQLRVKRSANTPKWLRLALAGDDDGEAPAEDGPPDEADLSAGGGSPLKNEERLLVVADLLPNSRHLLSLNLSGYGERLGPFVAGGLARAMRLYGARDALLRLFEQREDEPVVALESAERTEMAEAGRDEAGDSRETLEHDEAPLDARRRRVVLLVTRDEVEAAV